MLFKNFLLLLVLYCIQHFTVWKKHTPEVEQTNKCSFLVMCSCVPVTDLSAGTLIVTDTDSRPKKLLTIKFGLHNVTLSVKNNY